jgi:hypothetical protein
MQGDGMKQSALQPGTQRMGIGMAGHLSKDIATIIRTTRPGYTEPLQ